MRSPILVDFALYFVWKFPLFAPYFPPNLARNAPYFALYFSILAPYWNVASMLPRLVVNIIGRSLDFVFPQQCLSPAPAPETVAPPDPKKVMYRRKYGLPRLITFVFKEKLKRDWTRAKESGHPNLPEKPFQYQVNFRFPFSTPDSSVS